MSAAPEEREVRRVGECGSTFWVRRCGLAWVVTADGTHIQGPCDYATALAGLDAVAPLTPNPR